MEAQDGRSGGERESDPVDAVPPGEVGRLTLASAAGALKPTFYGTPLVFAVVAASMAGSAQDWRLVAWVVGGLLAAAIGIAAVRLHHASRSDAHGWLMAAMVAIGVATGAATWLAPASLETTVALCLVPVAVSALFAVLTGPRPDLYRSFQVPTALVSAAGLISVHDRRLAGLAAAGLIIAALAVATHRRIHQAVVDAIELTWKSDQLLARLGAEGRALAAVNERLAASNAQLAHQARHDALTNLHNRRGAIEVIDELLLGASAQRPLGLLYIDLDRFKLINDALGHRGGDQFIVTLTARMSRALAADAVAGRIGGDEFVVVLPGSDLRRSTEVANQLIGVLGQPVHAEGREVPSSVSIGVAVGPHHGTSSSDLLRTANAALHRAKQEGRNRVDVFDAELRDELETRVEGEQALRRALDHDAIVPFFQPEIDATTGQVVGVELLARWLQPDGSLLPASEFIATAAQAGLLERLTERVMAQARPHIRRLSAFGLPSGFRFRVNVPPRATKRSWNENPLESLVSGIEPALITVDVTEVDVLDDLAAAAANLAAFRARGGRVCLDDFARGISSLSLLRKLPLDEVRIDRASIDSLATHPQDRAIVRSIIAVVRELNLAVTADGVEKGAQADTLIALGCTRHQGHHYSPALPAEQLEAYLARHQAEALTAISESRWQLRDLGHQGDT